MFGAFKYPLPEFPVYREDGKLIEFLIGLVGVLKIIGLEALFDVVDVTNVILSSTSRAYILPFDVFFPFTKLILLGLYETDSGPIVILHASAVFVFAL